MSTIYICTSQPSQCIVYIYLSHLFLKSVLSVYMEREEYVRDPHAPYGHDHQLACMSQKRCYTAFIVWLVLSILLFQKVVCAANDEALEACPSSLTFDLIDEE